MIARFDRSKNKSSIDHENKNSEDSADHDDSVDCEDSVDSVDSVDAKIPQITRIFLK
jgi:hypothetical protein